MRASNRAEYSLMPKIDLKWISSELKSQRQSGAKGVLAMVGEVEPKQPLIFAEIASLARDGASDHELAGVVGYLTLMQRAAASINVGTTVSPDEYRESVNRAYDWFTTLQNDGAEGMASRIAGWVADVALDGEPGIWVACLELIKTHRLLEADLVGPLIITMHAIADVFSRRIDALDRH